MAGLVGLSAQESRDLRTVFDAYDSSSTGRISDINDLRKVHTCVPFFFFKY